MHITSIICNGGGSTDKTNIKMQKNTKEETQITTIKNCEDEDNEYTIK